VISVSISSPARSIRVRRIVAILVGILVGLFAGVVVVAAVWIAVFGAAVTGSGSFSIPLIAQTQTLGKDVSVTSGPGILVVPVLLATVGGLIGALVSRSGHRER
jgi:hypothetical protein